MIEIRVQCTCTAIQLTDLGEKLFRGDVLFVSKDRADKSKDLTVARSTGAVKCTEIIRCQEQKPATPPVVNPYLVPKDHRQTPVSPVPKFFQPVSTPKAEPTPVPIPNPEPMPDPVTEPIPVGLEPEPMPDLDPVPVIPAKKARGKKDDGHFSD